MDWVGEYHDRLVEDFLAEVKNLPHFPQEDDAVNAHVREYANCLASWVRGCDCWGFEVSLFQFTFPTYTFPGVQLS